MFAKKILPILTLLCFALNSPAPANVPNLNGKEAFVPGEILVRFKEEASPESRAKAMSAIGTTQTLNHPTLFKIKLKAGLDIPTALSQAKNESSILYAQPNYRYYASACGPPTDAYYTAPYNWPLSIIQAPQAWAQLPSSICSSQGAGSSGVTVAILDSGISRKHPDLIGVPLIGYNAIGETGEQDSSCTVCGYSGPPFTDSSGCTYSMDDFGHGTYVAGIVGAVWNGPTPNTETTCVVSPTSGLAGLAPGCTLLAVKVLDCTGSGTTDSIVLGTNYAVAHGARVLNFSLGSNSAYGMDPAEKEALDNALANNCVIVAAAGNDSWSGHLLPVENPAAYPPVIAVGATGPNDQVACYSNGGANLDLVAPGGLANNCQYCGSSCYNPSGDIFGCFLCPLSAAAVSEGGFNTFTDSNFGTAAGTSAAAPYVTGAAALILSAYPNLTNTQVAQAIINNADSLNGNQGWSPGTGYGRLNVYQALLNAGSGGGQFTTYLTTFNSPNPFYTRTNGTTNITIAITQAAPVELTIYDASGEVVFHKNYDSSQLNNNPSNPQFKSYYVTWDGLNGSGQPVVTGIYFYTVKANGQIGRNKIALIQGNK